MLSDTEIDSICKKCASYIKNIYREICFYPDEIKVEYKVGDVVHFTITGNERDDGVMIGRSGATIQALRLFIHAYSKAHMEGRPVIVQVKDHNGSKYNPVTPNHGFSRRPNKFRK